jgi:chemotaxis response regulator CheB
MRARTTQIGGTMSVTLRGMIDAEHDLTVVGEAGSGAEAIALAESLRPDVILMDLRMPDVDGVTATDGRGPPRSLCAPTDIGGAVGT